MADESNPPDSPSSCPAKFPLGQIVTTSNALTKITHEDILPALGRHVRGDWGDLDPEDWQANESALARGGRLFSAYHSADGVKFYIITEWDRSVTTVLLPEDY